MRRHTTATLRTGTAGWNIPRDLASEFPREGTQLERYSQVLSCCEINSSFYRSHKPETWERWARSVPADFRFAVKAPKTLTHNVLLHADQKLLESFFSEISALGEKLGPVLFQFPPKLQFDSAHVASFFQQVADIYKGAVVCEPRHVSWFEPEANTTLQRLRIARVAADPSLTPAAALPGGFPDLCYFRLHGSPRKYYSEYSPEFLAQLANSIPAKREAWCIFDNTASGAACTNALELDRLWRGLNGGCGTIVDRCPA